MKIIIPMAGKGTRLRPHTLTVPKPLIPVAGKPIIQRLVEELANAYNGAIEEIAFVIGDFGPEVERELISIAEGFGAKGRIYQQEKALGVGHAIYCAWESLTGLNQKLAAKGLAPVVLREVPGNLEDDDLIEMTDAGILPLVVAHDYLAEFWRKVFTHLTIHETLALRTGATIAVPFRKGSPKLAAELDAFLAKNGLGTAFGNMIEKRYLVNTKFAKSATSEAERKKFTDLVAFFKKYSDQYQLDFLLMAAQGYQESGLDQNAKSQVGAIGVMQVMPATGKELAVGDITLLENNIHAGVKYMRFMIDRYYKDEPMDKLNKGLFTFASYNAGPARVRQLRKEAEKRGLDPNVWFGNVEQIASERIGRETVTYVSNIYKYYIAYKLMVEDRARREAAIKAVQTPAK